jgi:hypothetical protein
MTADLSAEQLLAGAALRTRVAVPPELLADGDPETAAEVVLRPLSVLDLQMIAKAARDDAALSSVLMIERALVTPELDREQTLKLPAGLARFLLDRINELSGLMVTADRLAEHVQAPLAKACFVLAKEFGWTPEEVTGMTVGQILLYVQMARGEAEDMD